jgi:hypothetical protein
MPRPVVPAWFIAPERDPVTRKLNLTPECKEGHPWISLRETGNAAAWRGDMWMICTCRKCKESFLAYFSTGPIPLINCVALTHEQAVTAYHSDFDTPVSELMLKLGFASRPTRDDPTTRHRHRV